LYIFYNLTGCDSGFGQKLALRLNAMGVIVFAGVYSETSEGAENLKNQGCKVVQVDVTKDQDVKNAVEFVKKELGEKSE
jgi:3-hydroxybutyrate dehydrogenase